MSNIISAHQQQQHSPTTTIRTPLLRTIVAVYGNLGYQLHPLSTSHARNVATNAALNLWILHHILHRDVFMFDSVLSPIRTAKPLFALVVHLVFTYGDLLVIELTIGYYYLRGAALVRTLDSSTHLRSVYSDPTRVRWIVFWAILIHHTQFVVSYAPHIIRFVTTAKTLDTLQSFACLYVLTLLFSFLNTLLLYQHWATWAVMRRLAADADLNRKPPVHKNYHNHWTVLSEIRQLALLNHRLNQLLSFPLLLYLFSGTECIVSVVCMVIFYADQSGPLALVFLLYPILAWVYLAAALAFNRRSVRLFDTVVARVQNTVGVGRDVGGRVRIGPAAQQQRLSGCDWSSQGGRGSGHHHHHHRRRTEAIRLAEFGAQYRHLLELRCYSLTAVNGRLIVAVCLFSLNYIVFFNQTN